MINWKKTEFQWGCLDGAVRGLTSDKLNTVVDLFGGEVIFASRFMSRLTVVSDSDLGFDLKPNFMSDIQSGQDE